MKRCCICKLVKPDDDFHKHSGRKDGLQTKCKDCKRESDKEYYLADPKRHYRLTKRRKKEVRKRLSDIKAECGCFVCGEDEPACLDFHHLKDKSFSIARSVDTKSWSDICAEVKKCVVLCANCHRKLHANKVVLVDTSDL